MEPGAVYELNLRVSWDDVENYMALYAKWFLHVDLEGKAGRKLVTVLSRELGNDRNLVFLYWYESQYKKDYYCKSARAFFEYHLNKNDSDPTKVELKRLYADALATLGGEGGSDDAAIRDDAQKCDGDAVSPAVGETIRRVDQQFRRMVISDDASWNFGVSPCRVGKLLDAQRDHHAALDDDLRGCEKSLLEQATSVQQTATQR
jgi:hypothetical protein